MKPSLYILGFLSLAFAFVRFFFIKHMELDLAPENLFKLAAHFLVAIVGTAAMTLTMLNRRNGKWDEGVMNGAAWFWLMFAGLIVVELAAFARGVMH